VLKARVRQRPVEGQKSVGVEQELVYSHRRHFSNPIREQMNLRRQGAREKKTQMRIRGPMRGRIQVAKGLWSQPKRELSRECLARNSSLSSVRVCTFCSTTLDSLM
jgi:hypothetical protein